MTQLSLSKALCPQPLFSLKTPIKHTIPRSISDQAIIQRKPRTNTHPTQTQFSSQKRRITQTKISQQKNVDPLQTTTEASTIVTQNFIYIYIYIGAALQLNQGVQMNPLTSTQKKKNYICKIFFLA